MNIRRILPMEANLVIRNLKDFIFQKEYKMDRDNEKPICFYLDAATYGNLGDQAISLAIELFLNDTLGNEQIRVINEADTVKYIRSLKRQIRKDDIIVLSGGGNMGDLYPRYEALRRLIIKEFPDNRIVIFPQTIDYSSDAYGIKELKRAEKLYGGHRNLVICAREVRSFDILSKFCTNVVLVPDIVLYLLGGIPVTYINKCDCGICLREDAESLVSSKQRNSIYEMLRMKLIKYENVTTFSALKKSFLTSDERRIAIQEKLSEFASHRFIITDRLHGMIFCILTGIPCIVLDNSNHKVFGVYDVIKKNLDIKVKVATNIVEQDLLEIIDSGLEAVPYRMSNMVAGVFDELKEILNKGK